MNFKSNKLKMQNGAAFDDLVSLDYHLDEKTIELNDDNMRVEQFFDILCHQESSNTVFNKSSKKYNFLQNMLKDSTILNNVKFFFIVNGIYLILMKENNTWSTIFIKSDEESEIIESTIYSQQLKTINNNNDVLIAVLDKIEISKQLTPGNCNDLIQIIININDGCKLIINLLESTKDKINLIINLNVFKKLLEAILNILNNILTKAFEIDAAPAGLLIQLYKKLLENINFIINMVEEIFGKDNYNQQIESAINMIEELNKDIRDPRYWILSQRQ